MSETEDALRDMAVQFIYDSTDYEYMDLFDYFDTDDEEMVKALSDLISTARIEVSWP